MRRTMAMTYARTRAPRSRITQRSFASAAFMALAATGAGAGVVADVLPLAELYRPFAAVHGLAQSGLIATGVYLGLMAVVWPLAQILAGIETLAALAGGAAMIGALPFAQVADPGGEKASRGAGAAAVSARHEIQAGAYGGWNRTQPSDVRWRQPGGTDLAFRDIEWLGESFKIEPYWGLRGTWWRAAGGSLGLMFDYAHAKATADRQQILTQSGTRDGAEVPPREPFSATFRKLEFTHGLNFFTFNAVYRARGLHRALVPYAGLGIGLSVPHVDTLRAGAAKETRTYEHQITGLAFQALAGIEWRFGAGQRVSAFTEYKITRSDNEAALTGGGALRTGLWTHQVPLGVSYHYRFGRASR